MDRDQSQSHVLTESSELGSRAKIEERALALKEFRFSSELARLTAISKRTFSSDNRMAVQTFLGAVFNQVSRWQAEDRLEEELYRLLDSLKAPVPLKIGEAFSVVIYCTALHVEKKSRSKWARALRFAVVKKPDHESIKKFIKRKGGIKTGAIGMNATGRQLLRQHTKVTKLYMKQWITIWPLNRSGQTID